MPVEPSGEPTGDASMVAMPKVGEMLSVGVGMVWMDGLGLVIGKLDGLGMAETGNEGWVGIAVALARASSIARETATSAPGDASSKVNL
jgi:hypothetical protein